MKNAVINLCRSARLPALGICAALAAGQLAAQAGGVSAVGKVVQDATATPLQSTLTVQKVVRDVKGKESFESAANLVKGDILQFNATFTNNNPLPIRFDPQIAIPNDTELVIGSIKPPSGKHVKTPAGAWVVVWNVPNLPSRTWVAASLRVRYTRAAPVVAPVAAAASAPVAQEAVPTASAPEAAASQ